jgi:hypothetical protein
MSKTLGETKRPSISRAGYLKEERGDGDDYTSMTNTLGGTSRAAKCTRTCNLYSSVPEKSGCVAFF